MSAVVEVANVRKRYRQADPWAVDGVSFELQPGRAFGLLGPNGAGKSSVVKMITALTRPTSGTVRVFGSSPVEPAVRARIGFAPEDPDFPKYLRAGECWSTSAPYLAFRVPSVAGGSRRFLRGARWKANGDRSEDSPKA